MSDQPDHELEILEDDQTVPPRPEEVIADAGSPVGHTTSEGSAVGAAGEASKAD